MQKVYQSIAPSLLVRNLKMNGNATAIENEAVKSVHFKIAKTAKMDCSLQNFGEKKILVRIQHNSARINGYASNFIFFLSSFISSILIDSIQFDTNIVDECELHVPFFGNRNQLPCT